jgi:mRNA-degrading endonuclease RelE of RelBE toxin-antitoxin system
MPVEFSKRGIKGLKTLPSREAEALIRRLQAVAADGPGARRNDVKRLKGGLEGLWRVRRGACRAVFTWPGDIVLVLKIAHRKEAYR